MINIRKRQNGQNNLNLTPLIDIVFLLLIFFMLTTNFIEEEGIKIKLPESKSQTAVQEEVIKVFLTKDGKIYFKGKEIALNQLFDLIKTNLTLSKQKIVILKADKNVPLKKAVNILDIAKAAGAKKLIIATDKK